MVLVLAAGLVVKSNGEHLWGLPVWWQLSEIWRVDWIDDYGWPQTNLHETWVMWVGDEQVEVDDRLRERVGRREPHR